MNWLQILQLISQLLPTVVAILGSIETVVHAPIDSAEHQAAVAHLKAVGIVSETGENLPK